MVSLERELDESKRAEFNVPYNCIKIEEIEITEYLSDLIIEDADRNIFWLDFVSPSELGAQLANYATLLNLLNPNDIVRITLNANPGSLCEKLANPDDLQKARFETLKQRIPDIYFPSILSPNDMTRKNYPLALLKILKAFSIQSLDDKPPYSPNFMLPLFSSIYADGQQMLTFTGIVLNTHEEEQVIREALRGYEHNTFSWDKPCRIEIPALSIREITELNKLLPMPDVRQVLMENFPFIFSKKDGQAVDSYISYYKYYPNYHQVSL
jgi:hypothetical protein